METLRKYAWILFLLGGMMLFLPSCTPPALEVFLSPNPNFQSDTQTPPQQQSPGYQPFGSQSPQPVTVTAVPNAVNIQRINNQLFDLMIEADAHINSGEILFQDHDILGAIRELEQARIMIEQDIRPTFQHVEQLRLQGGEIQVLSHTQIQQLDYQIMNMQARINRAYDFETLYNVQRQVDRFETLRHTSKQVLHPVSIQRIQPIPATSQPQELPRPKLQSFPGIFRINVKLFADDIDRYIARFQQRRNEFQTCLTRKNQYWPQITAIFEDYGIPDDFAYIPLLESGFQPTAVSASGKAGLWQLSPGFAKKHGLRVSASRDDRTNIDASTRAVARSLSKLHRRFGSWELVLLGFIKGEQGVQNLVNRARTYQYPYIEALVAQSSQDRKFIALLTAATAIAKYPNDYGFGVASSGQTTARTTSSSGGHSQTVTLEPPVGTLY